MEDGKDKITELLKQLIKQVADNKINLSDNNAKITEMTADLREVKDHTDATRRAVDWEELGKHISKTIDQVTRGKADVFGVAAEIFTAAAQSSEENVSSTKSLANDLQTATRGVERLADSHKRDWMSLLVAMAVSAVLGAGMGFWMGKGTVETASAAEIGANIQSSSGDRWCEAAGGSINQADGGGRFCGIWIEKDQN